MNTGSIAVLLTLVTAAALPGAALAEVEDPGAYGDAYRQGDYGRVVHHENGPRIVRAESDVEPIEQASVNAPIFPGDVMGTDSDQRAEVQLSDGTIVRIDRNTEIGFEALPDVLAEYRDNTVLRLDVGSIRLVVSGMYEEDVFRVDTRAASVYVLGDGDYRVDVDGAGQTRAVSRRGVLEMVGEGGSVLVRGGMRADATPGYLPSDPRPIGSYDLDGFDRWCLDRDERIRDRARYARAGGYDDDDVEPSALPEEVRPYYGELAAHGRWVWVPDYGYSWYPYDVAPGWRPYHDGYWSYGPHGYFWVSNEPWGWAPYHYGRWNWVTGYGWCWTPGRVFAGAWVSWSWGSVHFGWAPLDYWGRPAFVRQVRWGYYDPNCWTFIRYEHVRYRDYRRYHVPATRIGDGLSRHAVVTRPPRVSPRRLAEGRDARERAVRLAREDRPSRLQPVRLDANRGRKLPDLERALAERPDRGGERASPQRRDTATRAPRATTRETRAASPGPRFPRQKSEDPRIRQRQRGSDPTGERVRDMYRSLARPRATEEKTRARRPEARRPAPRAQRPEARQPAPRAQRPEARRPAPRAQRPEARQPAPRAQRPEARRPAPRAQRPEARQPAPRAQRPEARQPAPRARPQAPSSPRRESARSGDSSRSSGARSSRGGSSGSSSGSGRSGSRGNSGKGKKK